MATMRPAHPMPRPPHGSRVLLFALAACSASAAACPSPCAPVDARPPAEICADATQPPEPVIAACTAVLANAPTPAQGSDALARRSAMLGAVGRVAEALDDAERLVALDPQAARSHQARGVARGGNGQFDGALADLERARALAPGSSSIQSDLGTLWSLQSQFARADAAYTRAIALDADAWLAWSGRCWARVVTARSLDGARTDCDRALALNPRDGNTLNSRGLVHFRAGRNADAVADYTLSLYHGPVIPSSFYVRGLALARMGDADAAAADIAKGIALEPGIEARYAAMGVER